MALRGKQVEIKAYLSEMLADSMRDELVRCGCTQTGFIRTAILHELQRRMQERIAIQKIMGTGGDGDAS
jgi:hypothetical protein